MAVKKVLAGAAATVAGVVAVTLAVLQIDDPNRPRGMGVASFVLFLALLVGSVWYLMNVPPIPPAWVRRWGWVAVGASVVGLIASGLGLVGFRVTRSSDSGFESTTLPSLTNPSTTVTVIEVPSPTAIPSAPSTASSESVVMLTPPPGKTATATGRSIRVSGVASPQEKAELWLFDHDFGDGYTRDNDAPLEVDANGSWSFMDGGLTAGSSFQLVLVRANEQCARFIHAIKKDQDETYYVDNLDPSCTVVSRTTIEVH